MNSIVLILGAILCIIYFWQKIGTSTKAMGIMGIIGIIITIYNSTFKPLIMGSYKEKEIKETEEEYEKEIEHIQDIKKVQNRLSMEAQEISVYLRKELEKTNINYENKEAIRSAVELYENGKFENSILEVGRTLEKCVNCVLESLNKKHILKLSVSKQRKMSLGKKVEFLFSEKKISHFDLSKLDIIRKYRNFSAHPSKEEMINASKNAKLVIELGIELIEKIEDLSR